MNPRSEAILNHPLHAGLGIELLELTEDRARTRFTITHENASISDSLHGGVLYLLADVTAAVLAFSRIDDDEIVVSHSVQFALMRTAQLGDQVELEAELAKLGRNLVFLEVSAWQTGAEPARKLASGTVIKSRVRTG